MSSRLFAAPVRSSRIGENQARSSSPRRSSGRWSGSHRRRGGFTLLEVLIATAITLLMMLSLVQVFKVIGDSMKQGRAALQMNNTLRAVTFRLRNDLANLTVRVDPPSDQSSGGGYLKYFDGSMTDYTAQSYLGTLANRFGDTDDILMFTARAGDSWFTGQVPGTVLGGSAPPVTITSQVAEIAVFTRPLLSDTGALLDNDSNLFPDGYQLHYRVLLVRPDLNNALGVLPGLEVGIDSPIAMADMFQLCDLSMHRIYSTTDGKAPGFDFVAANNLGELSNPANRFAHYQFPVNNIPPLSSSISTTMPLLVLDPIPQAQLGAFAANDRDPVSPQIPLCSAGNFLHRSYVLGGTRTGEDILATNVLAFDVKGYDSGAPLVGLRGADGEFGRVISTSPLTYSNIFGEDGTDDILVTPNDPGFVSAPLSPVSAIVGRGAYVDLLWGLKVHHAGRPFSSLLSSELSGLDAAGTGLSAGILRSGSTIFTSGIPFILQPAFDTWTTEFESNGTLEAQLTPAIGVLAVNNLARRLGNTTSEAITASDIYRRTTTDAGTDGIDNNGTGGVDEAAERETLPPFPVKLRGLKISVRIEDSATRQVKQMSVANEFVTQ